MVTAQQIEERVRKHLPSATVRASDLTGGGDHWSLKVVAEEFRGKSRVQQHQLIYQALGEWMQGPIHALALDTSAPAAG